MSSDNRTYIRPSNHGLRAPSDGGPGEQHKPRPRMRQPQRREHRAEEIAAARAIYARVDDLPQEEHPGLSDRERDFVTQAAATQEMLDIVLAMESQEDDGHEP